MKWLLDFLIKRSRVALAWFISCILGIFGLYGCIRNQWGLVETISILLGSIVGAYNISQAYTKGQFIKKASDLDSKIEIKP